MSDKKRKSVLDRLTYAYIRRIKKWMFCPACQEGKMSINKASTVWNCENCGYSLSAAEFEDDYVFWFCDDCNSYLNNQEGFCRDAKKHVCRKCGFENDTSFDNIKGICSDCGKTLPDADSTLCVDCKLHRHQIAKERLLMTGKAIGTFAAVAGVAYLASQASGDTESTMYAPPDEESIESRFGYVTSEWMERASEDELREAEREMFAALEAMDYDSQEYLHLDLIRIDVVNTIASRFPLNLPKREHGWYLPNDD